MLRLALWILLSCPLPVLAEAPSPEDLFQNGLAAYQNKKYDEARDFFQKTLEQKNDSTHVLHNLALTYFQLNQKPYALAFWRRALAIDPSFRAARAGRDLLEGRFNMRPFERDALSVWRARTLNNVSIFELLWLAAFTLSLSGWFWIRYLSERRQALDEERSLPAFPMVAPVISSTFLLCLFLIAFKVSDGMSTRATVVTASASAHSLPAEDAVALFELSGGSEVLVQRQQSGWSQVQNGDGSTGWVKDGEILVTSER